MKKVKFVFVILVYKNMDDLECYLKDLNLKVANKEVIVINSYFDDETMNKARAIANKYECVFENVENKGYGYGNNRGIEKAKRLFDFEYLIVSNADVEIEFFNEIEGDYTEPRLIGPIIKNLNQKYQNPYRAYRMEIANRALFYGYKSYNKSIIKLGYAIHRICREFFMVKFKINKEKYTKVYGLHGSFVIFSRGLIDILDEVFCEKMFLFNEEFYIAKRMEKLKLNSYITNQISILHKEDGSISISQIDEKNELRKSLLICYEELKGENYEKIT